MPSLQTAALKSRLWLGGQVAPRDPVPVQITSKRLEARAQTSNGAMRIDRMFTLAGMPNVRNRREFTLPWPDLRESSLLQHLDILAGIGQPFGFGLWKLEYDVFDGDGSNKTFYLQRRQILTFADPSTALPEYGTRLISYSGSYLDPASTATELTVVSKTSGDIAAGDPASGEAWVEDTGHQVGNLWVSTVRLGDAAPAASDCLVAAYVPMYEVLIDTDGPLSFAQALVTPRSLKLVEFG
jgi:hypothetical protein